MKPFMLGLVALLPFLVCAATQAGGFCDGCGCDCEPRKVCHLIREMKTVPKTKYSFECEDICVPDPSCVTACRCTESEACLGGRLSRRYVKDREPTGAKVYRRTKLVKKTVDEEKPSYRWVVESLCPECAAVSRHTDDIQPASHSRPSGRN